jgi:hypothetical protein
VITPDVIMAKLTDMEATLTQIVQLLEALLAPAPVPSSAPESPVPIATYEQMYGPIEPGQPVVDLAQGQDTPRPRRGRRWFVREEQA